MGGTAFEFPGGRSFAREGSEGFESAVSAPLGNGITETLTYDGDGNRVQKSNGKIYWYGAGTEILDESDLGGNFTDEYVFFGGKRVAHVAMRSGNVYYYAEDFLGSSRVITDSQGNVCYEADFDPYGAEWAITTSCPQNYKFQGKERDAETNNDDFGARYYSSRLGRWLSADWSSVPAPVPYANLTNPQTLNLYAMVSDNPETFADLDGHFLPSPEGKDTASPANPCSNGNSSMCSGAAENTTAQPPPTQQTQQAANPQPAADPQLVVTMTILVPTGKIAPNQTETVAGFGVAYVDANGNKVSPDEHEQHPLTMTMTETLDTQNSRGPVPPICSQPCGGQVTGTGTIPDTMTVSGNQVVVLNKRFTIDGHPAKVYDPSTRRARDFVHQESSVKGGTKLTYGDDPPK